MSAAPGTTMVVKFEIRDPITHALVNPSGVVIEYAHLGAAAVMSKTYGVDGEITRPSTGVYVIPVPCPTAGGYGARLRAQGTYQGVFEHYWQIDESELPAIV